jgi:hypothetical protein
LPSTIINGIDAIDSSGFSVSGAGDVNNDGFADILIGAYYADPNGASSAGETYVVYGSANLPAVLNLSALDGNNGIRINGIDTFDYSGFSVSGAGDVNNDGFADILIGAYGAGPNGADYAGETYVVYGSKVPSFADLSIPDKLQVLDINLQAQNAELEVLNTDQQAQNAKLEVLNNALQVQNAKLEILNTNLDVLNTDLQAQNAMLNVLKRGFQNKLEAQNTKLEAILQAIKDTPCGSRRGRRL